MCRRRKPHLEAECGPFHRQDYSKNSYEIGWTTACWWDQHVIVYGGEDVTKSHPVIKFLAHDNHAKSLSYLKGG